MVPDTWVTRLEGASARRALSVYSLTIVKGAGKGQVVEVATPRFRIGALDGNDLVLRDPSVSGLHLELAHDVAGIRIRDLGSKNGTRVNGVRILEALLAERATIALGATELKFSPEARVVEPEASPATSFGPLKGTSAVMRELFAVLERCARTDSTVLITGETGTGKELVAEALVQASSRAEGPLVVVDCSALAPTLVESALFGHEKGAFTGAVAGVAGVFERAHRGTVFLDEVGELPLELQPRLLRVLERREVQRLGGKAPVSVDVRILAATHRGLAEEVNRGRFRADLFYRLSVLRAEVPPLRARREDIPLLVSHFAPGLEVDARTMERLMEHDWPGNVRELRNAVERLQAGAEPIRVEATTPPASEGGGPVPELGTPFLVQKERLVTGFERRYARMLLDACRGNLAEGARLAGMSRMAVVKLLGRLGIEP